MFMGLTFCVIGYFAILIKNGKTFGNERNSEVLFVHQMIGFIAFVLFVFQTIPNWFHWTSSLVRTVVIGMHTFFGVTCYILGCKYIHTKNSLKGVDHYSFFSFQHCDCSHLHQRNPHHGEQPPVRWNRVNVGPPRLLRSHVWILRLDGQSPRSPCLESILSLPHEHQYR